MSGDREFTLQSMDVSALPQAPAVTFRFAEDNYSFEASPPGGHIHVSAVGARGDTSRIVLTNTLTDEVFADIQSQKRAAPSTGEQWENAACYAAELACALYWSMWRMQQIKAQATAAGAP